MKKVLFLCIHNSARSQMAEAFLKKFGSDRFLVNSAGLEPGKINPLAVTVMKEEGIDISSNPVNDVFSYHQEGRSFDYVITVCDPAASDACPVFPGMHQKINWSFADPSGFGGSEEERVNATRVVRDQIKKAVLEFIQKHS
jgi:arsenate reductase